KQPHAKPPTRGQLRSEAEARLAQRVPPSKPPLTAEELLHELRVHQIELEMQNEQLRLTQTALEESRDLYADLYEFAPVGYLALTGDGRVAHSNHVGAKLLGLARKDLLGRRFDQFVAPACAERWRRLFTDLKTADARLIDELELQPVGANAVPAEVEAQRKAEASEESTVVRLVLIDLSSRKAATRERRVGAVTLSLQDRRAIGNEGNAWEQALTDPLTGLPNRRLMMDRLHHALVGISRSKQCCALLFIDLDKFKALNDSLGHDLGDEFLRQVAQRLSSCVREGDTVARHGGDEFVVILEKVGECPDQAAILARSIGEKIATALDPPFKLDGHDYLGSASIGATVFNDPHDAPDELLKRADMAMYEAKTAGRNALRFFDPAMQATVAARAALEADLRGALSGGQLQCHFQGQTDDAGRIHGAEVLLRWQHPERGLMSSAAFIRVAEETGLLVTIGQWVLETACAQLKTWEGSRPGRHLRLAVNVGARQFHQPSFVEDLRAVLERSGANPGDLTLEFKEKTVLADLDESVARMAALKKLGVRLAIDDFGVGCSSLSQLTRLSLDQLKIDPSVVRQIGARPQDKAIVQTLIDVTRNLEMETVAEGVETEAQHAFLERHGCHAFQGYLFCKPVPAAEFEHLLTLH
ncbi:MAG TPA: EAL domain-containing protein, partial [Parasulfuritortus sp.]